MEDQVETLQTDVLLIGLRPGRSTPFMRSVRKGGEVVRVFQFQPGVALAIETDEEFEAIKKDVGNSLVVVVEKDDGKQRFDPEATKEFVLDVALDMEKKGDQLSAMQKGILREHYLRERAAKEAEELAELAAMDVDDDNEDDGELTIVELYHELGEQLAEIELQIEDLPDDAQELPGLKKERANLKRKRTNLQKQVDELEADDTDDDEDAESDDDSEGNTEDQ